VFLVICRIEDEPLEEGSKFSVSVSPTAPDMTAEPEVVAVYPLVMSDEDIQLYGLLTKLDDLLNRDSRLTLLIDNLVEQAFHSGQEHPLA
jgi:hypothetical protein